MGTTKRALTAGVLDLLNVKGYSTEALKQAVLQIEHTLLERRRRVRPMAPWLVVKICEKAQQEGLVILPEKQSKVTYEGIVLAVWEEHDIVVKGKTVHVAPSCKIGDRVLFPHWAGVPLEGFARDRYRLVKESWTSNDDGGAFACIDYDDGEQALTMLSKWMWEIGALRDKEIVDFVEKVNQKFILVEKDAKSVTLS
jgi:co-chaperonin GroES (HSP10)